MFQLREFQILSSDSKGNIWKLGRRIAAEIFGILGDSLKRNLFMPYTFHLYFLSYRCYSSQSHFQLRSDAKRTLGRTQ